MSMHLHQALHTLCFVDHSDYYFIVFPAALDDAAEIRLVKGGVRGHAIADCADDEQPDRVAL